MGSGTVIALAFSATMSAVTNVQFSPTPNCSSIADDPRNTSHHRSEMFPGMQLWGVVLVFFTWARAIERLHPKRVTTTRQFRWIECNRQCHTAQCTGLDDWHSVHI